MTPGEVERCMRRLFAAFPMTAAVQGMTEVWVENLDRVGFEAGWAACKTIEREADKFPTVHQFLMAAQAEARRLITARDQTALPAPREPQLLDKEMRDRVRKLSEQLASERKEHERARPTQFSEATSRTCARLVLELADLWGVGADEVLTPNADGDAVRARVVAVELVRVRTACGWDSLAYQFRGETTEMKQASVRGANAVADDPETRKRAAKAWAAAFGDAPPFAVTATPPDPEPQEATT